MERLFTIYMKNDKLKDVLHLSYLLIKERGELKKARNLYSMVVDLFPLWNRVYASISENNDKIELFEELFRVQMSIINDGHINLQLLDEQLPQQPKESMFLFIKYSLDSILWLLPFF